ncbi:glycoside hydrolase family 9 protein, partial [Balneolaceae bacterium ANBcel3]|nr:glycoside hydrolase family 9 protein [Balneolaceae bacterium ANBcel3]
MAILLAALPGLAFAQITMSQPLTINEEEYFERKGVNVLSFSNAPGGMFNDSKTSGVEIIHHGIRTATNGDVRFLHTPEQWDGLGNILERTVDKANNTIETKLEYPEYHFEYRIRTTAKGNTMVVSVHLDEPLPPLLEGRAGFNMEFIPAEYFGKTWKMDQSTGLFPRHPSGPMNVKEDGSTEPTYFAKGNTFILAPEDPERRVTIREATGSNELMVFDGRNKAQNGWYVVRSLIPAEQSGKVIEWEIDIHAIPDWIRTPVITYSQVGYHPDQPKRAVIELDKNDQPEANARLLRVQKDGELTEVLDRRLESWGRYLRYNYVTFDFSEIREPGIYKIAYGDQTSGPVRIDPTVHDDTWHLTLDVFFPVQMDHMKVREAYRVWHGASHLDDAIQAPPHYEHFDLYRHEETDTDFETFEHIPGLNYGGWYDAGDYDIRTQSQYFTVQHLVHTHELFQIERDNTTVSQETRYVEIHRPDGVPDIIQQIEHGTLGLIAQHRAVGHAIPGIVAGHLYQYTHLGDGITKTNNMIYDPEMDPFADQRHPGTMYNPSTTAPGPDERVMENDGIRSGHFDSRWAFTTNTSALNYGSAASLAAASRVLRGYNDDLAEECIETALNVWEYEQGREPNL